MREAHVHTWKPVDGECGQYACECEATGYRHRSGMIREHLTRKPRRVHETARPATGLITNLGNANRRLGRPHGEG
jgi:hypothetical protein